MSENIKVIGIDCATLAQNTGLSLGVYSGGWLTVGETRPGTRNIPIAETIYSWIGANEKALLSIDAPLGWPVNLGQVLYNHSAGKGIAVHPNDLFRRATDRFIRNMVGKQSLDVGAGRIARTAHSALKLIMELSNLMEKTIGLAWDNVNLDSISVIEVYPAATLCSYGINSKGYKEKTQHLVRREMITDLRKHMAIPEDMIIPEQNADVLDSIVCLLGAKDFMDGDVYYPEDISLAEKEGWIWVKKVRY